MPEKKVRVEIPGTGPVDGFEVGVSESTERWTEVRLEDGTVLRTKQVIIAAIRIDGRYDADGNPVYSLKINPIMAMVSAPEHLRKGGSAKPKGIN